MAKRKRNNAHASISIKSKGPLTPPQDSSATNGPSTINAITSPEEVEIAVETLQALAEHPSLIKSKACKDLRTAVYAFKQASTTGMIAAEGGNLTARISAALTDGRYLDSRILLAEMRIRKETPSLGALCRWVRTLDVISGLSIHVRVPDHDIVGTNSHNAELIQVLDAILRVTGPTDITSHGLDAYQGCISLQETWDLRGSTEPTRYIRRTIDDKSIFASCAPNLKSRFRAVETTPGPQRKPPNLHPAILFASQDNTVPLGLTPKTSVHKHPLVPNLRLIRDVLTPAECASIIAAGETMEFIPDAPLRPQGEDTSVLAHNFYWIVDQAFHDALWERVKDFVPREKEGKADENDADEKIVDGAWPPSGIDPVTDAYQYDASPPNAKQSSLYTFLIYLNDDFKGGETTFFIPSVKEGVLNAYPIKPIMGSVAVFPHGEAQDALLHEGTGVVEGAKYVIRTDVEYDVEPRVS
ncbi:hypothetical protein SLS60_006055 [Paraconiothyrium brasiliense]|uniref:Prolyl 4-hydroxylase alpha subunit domain-containing protein n=1 Tax=Paraconiothyrium brasiliense TaxID=300254 RepID=A0ABR3REL6_9PLEO